MVSAEDVEARLREALSATDVTVIDNSGGCGTAFTVAVVSPLFEGKKLLEKHKMVNEALKVQLASIHALSIKKVWTPGQQAAAQSPTS